MITLEKQGLLIPVIYIQKKNSAKEWKLINFLNIYLLWTVYVGGSVHKYIYIFMHV